jgi:hypothetical protein
METVRKLMATWADYTVGTFIVIAHMVRAEHQGRRLREANLPAAAGAHPGASA